MCQVLILKFSNKLKPTSRLKKQQLPPKWRLIDSGFVARGQNNGSHCSAVTFLHDNVRRAYRNLLQYPAWENKCLPHQCGIIWPRQTWPMACWLTGWLFWIMVPGKFSNFRRRCCCRWRYWKVACLKPFQEVWDVWALSKIRELGCVKIGRISGETLLSSPFSGFSWLPVILKYHKS